MLVTSIACLLQSLSFISTYLLFVSCSVPDAPIASWEFSRGNLAIERVIGHGAFGMVSKAYARDLPGKPDWTIVAVKSLQGKHMFDNIMADKLLNFGAKC